VSQLLYNKQTGEVSWFLAIPVGLVVLPIILICWWYLGSFYGSIAWAVMSWSFGVQSVFFVFPAGLVHLALWVVVQLFAVLVLPILTFVFVISLSLKILELW
jgi:hypothetical protein